MEESQNKTNIAARIKHFATRTIWEQDIGKNKITKALIAFLRVLISTVDGIVNKRILVQASSLSYATLLAIGPILAITILFSGIFFKDMGEHFIYEKIMQATTFVMPAFNEMMSSGTNAAQGAAESVKINPEIMKFIDNLSRGSAKAGTVGIITMLVTCLLLCVNMETAFNYIWGVKKGRKWIDRIVFYFATIFFGSVGAIFSMAFFATSQLAKFAKNIPFISDYAPYIAYSLGIVMMATVLASFYKFIPLARVKWKPAFVGGIVILCALLLNNKMSFIYISYIAKQQDFYGYLAIVAVAMFSLYIFWTMILTGCQITYAVQYVDFLSDDEAWNKMGDRAKKLCALAVFAEIEKSFYESKPHSPTVESILSAVKMPKAAVLACLDLLAEKNFISAAEFENGGDDVYYKPAIDPEKITVSAFFATLGANEGDEDTIKHLCALEDSVKTVLQGYEEFAKTENGSRNLKQILA